MPWHIAQTLKEGEEIDLHLVGARSFEVVKKPSVTELLARLHQLRGRLSADFHFDRLDANIVASALMSGAPVLLSEDMHSGMLVDGLVIPNPFKETLS